MGHHKKYESKLEDKMCPLTFLARAKKLLYRISFRFARLKRNLPSEKNDAYKSTHLKSFTQKKKYNFFFYIRIFNRKNLCFVGDS